MHNFKVFTRTEMFPPLADISSYSLLSLIKFWIYEKSSPTKTIIFTLSRTALSLQKTTTSEEISQTFLPDLFTNAHINHKVM